MAAPLSRADAEEVLADVYQVASKKIHDFDTARQLTGAIVILCDELGRKEDSPETPGRLPKTVARLRKGFNLQEDLRVRVEETLQQSLGRRSGFQPAVFSRLISSLDSSGGE